MQEHEPSTFYDHNAEDRFNNVDEYLFSSLGLASKQNAWAGPEHWKYRKTKGWYHNASTSSFFNILF